MEKSKDWEPPLTFLFSNSVSKSRIARKELKSRHRKEPRNRKGKNDVEDSQVFLERRL